MWIVVAASLSQAGPPTLPAADWPQFRGAAGDGVSAETGWSDRFGPDGPRVLWERRIGAGYASVSIVDGRLYSAGWADGQTTVYCLDAETGDDRWTHRYPIERHNTQHQGGPAGTPAVDGDRVYTLSREAQLFCLHAGAGTVLWSKRLMEQFGVQKPQFAFAGSPVVHGDTLFVDVGCIAAFDKRSGRILWQSKDYGPAYSTPVPFTVDERPLLAAFPQEGLVIFDRSTGQERAVHPWSNPYGNNAVVPVIEGRRLFISSGDNIGGVLLELTGAGLEVAWEAPTFRNKMATSVLLDGHLYGFDVAVLKCIDIRTGRSKWKQRGLGRGSLMAADGRLIILSEKGELVIAAATAKSFVVHDRAEVLDAGDCWVVPVLAEGRIYCRSGDGRLVCIDMGKQRNADPMRSAPP
jgi:outer membrane protein assembly factor BamB